MLLGSIVLEVAIGLFFVYLLLSLLCSAISEYIEAKFNNRAKYLRQGITLLLNDTDSGGVDLAKQLYEHGLIRPLYRDGNKLPSYIPSRTFSLALWNLATAAAIPERDSGRPGAQPAGVTNDLKRIREVVATSLPNHELRAALLTLIDEANGDLEKARRNIEEWYDAMMDRVAGWYKRLTSVMLLVLGFGTAVLVNADTISIAQTLARDGVLRASIIGAAQERLATPLPPSTATAADPEARDRIATQNLGEARATVDALGLPLGWVTESANKNDPRRLPGAPFEWLLKIIGLALTGFAVSQGAPFWFDLLNKFIVIRSTVKPAEKSQTQPSKDRPAPKTEIDKDDERSEGPAKG
jgi:hypothetical protein